jgi:hypothetical protein
MLASNLIAKREGVAGGYGTQNPRFSHIPPPPFLKSRYPPLLWFRMLVLLVQRPM